MCEALLSHNANVNICNKRGNTALMLAIKFCKTSSHLECIKLLVSSHAKINHILPIQEMSQNIPRKNTWNYCQT